MSRRTAAPEQPDLLDGLARLSQFRQTKQREPQDFAGTDNPRHLRVLHALLQRHRSREEIDLIAAASNGPESIRQLREMGLTLPCYKLGVYDFDNKWVFRGLYALSHRDRQQVARALASGKGDRQVAQDTASEAATKGNMGGRHAK
ncbi:MAG: hypothetical protein U7M05_12280 [Candidatus Igneacidithiobacillus chanchocoensis]